MIIRAGLGRRDEYASTFTAGAATCVYNSKNRPSRARRYSKSMSSKRRTGQLLEDDRGHRITHRWMLIKSMRSVLLPTLSVTAAGTGGAVGAVLQSTMSQKRVVLFTGGWIVGEIVASVMTDRVLRKLDRVLPGREDGVVFETETETETEDEDPATPPLFR